MQYQLNDLNIDTDAREVRRHNIELKLSDLSFDTLLKLIEHSPAPVSTEVFARQVWGTKHVSDETVAQRITLLRKVMGDNPKKPQYIRTVRGQGYAINGNVKRLDVIASPKPHSNQTFRVGLIAATVLLAIVSVTFVIDNAETHTVSSKTPMDTPLSANSILIDRAQQQLSLHQATETNRAIDMLRQALKVESKRFDARLTLSFALSTKTTKFGGSAEEEQEAEAIARALISERSDSSNAWSALAYALSSQGREEESLSAYQVAYQLDPANAPALSSAAHLHLLRGELHQALLLELQAKKVGGSSRYAEIQIAQLLELIEHPATKIWQEKALSLNPGQVVVISELARSFLRKGDPEAALRIASRAVAEDRFSPSLLQLRGRAEYSLGNIEEAVEHFEAAGDWGHYELAAIRARQGDKSGLEALLSSAKHAGAEKPPTPEIGILLAEALAASGEEVKALEMISQAVNQGWRDAGWLIYSPFVGPLMASDKGQQIQQRIAQALIAQRRLIEGTESLNLFLSSHESTI